MRHKLSKMCRNIPLFITLIAFLVGSTQCRRLGTQFFDRNGVLPDRLRHYGRVPSKRSIGGVGGNSILAGGGSDSEQDLGGMADGRYSLSIRDAPPKLVEARQHGKVVLECSAYGSPAPQITWFKDGQPLYKDGKHNSLHHFRLSRDNAPDITDSLSETKSKVTLDCLSQEDAGLYQCVASNGFTKTSVATELSVVSFEEGTCKDPFEANKPTINQHMENYVQFTGMDALLMCRSAGPHETYWIGPTGLSIDVKSEKYQMTSSGDLIVRNLSFEDMGMFQCLVKNTEGHDMIETFLYPLAAS